jgi:peptidoglycan/LPS O-acetylase OafA/YrhL
MRHVASFDGLRGIAVLLVIFFHATMGRFAGGFLGVDLFFALSGFLITSTLVDEYKSSGGISLGAFYARRVLRLMPALFAMLAVYVVIAIFLAQHAAQHLTAAAFAAGYVMNWVIAFNLGPAGFVAHTWSLGVEEQFYLLWPALLLLVLSWAGRRAAVGIGVMLLAVSTMWRVYLAAHGASWERTYCGFDTGADAMFAGCVLALVDFSPEMLSFMCSSWYIPAALISGFCVVAAYGAHWMQFWGMTVFGLCAAWLVRFLAISRGSLLDTVLEWTPLQFLGRISYGVYLWHLLILWLLLFAHLQDGLIILAILPLSVIVALLSYALIELPFLRLKARRFARIRPYEAAPVIAALKA